MPLNVTVWSEFRHEKKNPKVKEVYPDGMHEAIASHLRKNGDLNVRTATLDEPQHGLTDDVLESTDVMTWWGHMAHDDVDDKIAEKVRQRVLAGMGLIVLHSGHFSKVFKSLMGTTCDLKWREADDKEVLWVTSPKHPITRGHRRPLHAPGRGDVRRVLRRAGAGGHGVHQLVHRRRGVPQRADVQARRGQDLLLPPRPRDVPDLPRRQRPEGDRKRASAGPPRPARSSR